MKKQYVIKFGKAGSDVGGDAIWADRRLNYHSVMCLAHEELDKLSGLGYNCYSIYQIENNNGFNDWVKVDNYTNEV